MGVSFILKKNVEMIVTIKLKKCVVNTHIFCIIKCKLRYGQEPCLVILFPIDINPEIDLHYIIFAFGLAICLRMEGNEELLFDAKKRP